MGISRPSAASVDGRQRGRSGARRGLVVSAVLAAALVVGAPPASAQTQPDTFHALVAGLGAFDRSFTTTSADPPSTLSVTSGPAGTTMSGATTLERLRIEVTYTSFGALPVGTVSIAGLRGSICCSYLSLRLEGFATVSTAADGRITLNAFGLGIVGSGLFQFEPYESAWGLGLASLTFTPAPAPAGG